MKVKVEMKVKAQMKMKAQMKVKEFSLKEWLLIPSGKSKSTSASQCIVFETPAFGMAWVSE